MSVNQLYKSYDPRLRHPVVFSKSFDPEFIEISLRPFFIANDFTLYNVWIKKEIGAGKYRKEQPPVFSEKYFEALLESSNAQCLCGLIDKEPVFQVDLYRALHYYPIDHIDGIRLEAGDVMMQLIMAPHVVADEQLTGYVLSTCLEYLSGFQSLRRVFWTDADRYHHKGLGIGINPGWESVVDSDQHVCGYALNPIS